MSKDFFKIKKGIKLPEVELPSDGASGDIAYTQDGLQLYHDGDWGAIGSGGAGIDFLVKADKSASWDVTNGTATSNSTQANVKNFPLSKTALEFAKTGSSDMDAELRFSIPAGYQNTLLRFNSFVVVDGVADPDWKIEVWSNTAEDYSGSWVQCVQNQVPDITNDIVCDFMSQPYIAHAIRIVHKSGASTSTKLYLSGMICGPGMAMSGFDGRWKTYPGNVESFTCPQTGFSYNDANSWFRPYTDLKGDWYLAGQLVFGFTSASISSLDITPSSLVWGSIGAQPVDATLVSLANATQSVATFGGSGNIAWRGSTSGNVTGIQVKFDSIKLDAKPAWVDFEPPLRLLTPEVLNASAYLYATYGTTALSNNSNIIPSSIVVENSHGIEWDSVNAMAKIKADGKYNIVTNIGVDADASATRYALLEARLNTNAAANRVCAARVGSIVGVASNNGASREIYLKKDDEIYFRINTPITGLNTTGDGYLYFSISRISDNTEGSAVGLSLADENRAGLVSPEGNIKDTHIADDAAIAGTKLALASALSQGASPPFSYYAGATFSISGLSASANINIRAFKLGNFVWIYFNPSGNVTKSGSAGSLTVQLSSAFFPAATTAIIMTGRTDEQTYTHANQYYCTLSTSGLLTILPQAANGGQNTFVANSVIRWTGGVGFYLSSNDTQF